MYMFLDWVKVNLGFTLFPLFDFIFGWVVNEARVFCVSLVFSGLGCPCLLLVYYFAPPPPGAFNTI